MKEAWAATSRAAEVREAARGWAAARAIDAPALRAIDEAYPDPRIVLHPAWRVLVFLIGCAAIGGLYFGIFRASLQSLQWPSTVTAIALIAATEILRGSRLSGTGADSASSFLAWVFALVAAILLLDDFRADTTFDLTIASSCLLAALFAWRWGFWAFAGLAAGEAFVLAARLSGGRAIGIVLAVALLSAAGRLRERASVAPAHRRCLTAAFVVAAAALYLCVNLYALDRYWVEAVRVLLDPPPTPPPVPFPLRLAAMLATAAFPVAFLVWGIRSRRRLLLGIGLASAILSIATFRHYVPIGPRWAWLTFCGAAVIAASLWIHRRLRDAAGGAWRGLTAAPLYGVDDGGVTPVGAVIGAQVAVPSAPEPDRGGYTGGGGSFGGGGASGQF